MAFYFSKSIGAEFRDFRELCLYAEEEKEALQRWPIREVLAGGGRFYGDHSFGVAGEGFQFEEEGLRAFCSLMKVPFGVMTTIEKEGLATDLANDLLDSSSKELNKHDLITDVRTGRIIGVVSGSYVTYSNFDLLVDLKNLCDKSGIDSETKLGFETGYLYNSHLRARFRSEIEVGVIRGKGGTGEDKSVVGLQFANSMTGESAVRIEFYLYRLLCANGIIAPVSHTENAVFHSGKRQNFFERLNNRFVAVLRGADRIIELWQKLAEIEFDPRGLAHAGFTSEILDICPEAKEQLKKVGSDLELPENMPREEKRLRRDTAILESIPKQLAAGNSAKIFQSHWRENRTLFDFVNLFTERAKEYENVVARIDTEAKAGRLATGLFNNQRKLRAGTIAKA